ncbi:zinc-binding protein (Yippee) [Leishmania donovani]|uniref:Protein yippee-like n=3 Tax=Leishmania donovani species complex TaxID=38574 RepID=A4I637_LEIIN|nr:putative zinc-binding protein (Yippee) [Leishmania infantum JPCM5]TPP43185.1 Yippee zinc-binding/DNA-binding /Mis18, centromere assembly family protein [Leishmania donovani]CAC9516120.1 zinc-binding_protein_(Yippee)_-_putative [Leishmania infantum]CAJ1991145.1 zinc-binding protein (Yippee) [Leishmania donovani]CAM70259.1 putative zinc-binding protein (Yippee) [Leishmania infantum JPCM5]SUZ44171.1 zinc-binding_protein_(Yippee)_-_putative [Leishmania infantum]|eukprot:XP_001467206.1 putative zinc-binding protein (Yippee) [Leishmania infantum JPCM5]
MVRRLRTRLAAPSGGEGGFGCAFCGAHLCIAEDIVSDNFRGRHGKAFLVSRCENTYYGHQEEKQLMTGLHRVRDVFCSNCDQYVGWGYDFAVDEREMYKMQRFVLERQLIRVITHGQLRGALGYSIPDGSITFALPVARSYTLE